MTNPAPPYKGFLMLRDKRNPPCGWTESLWINQDSFKTSLAALEEIAVPRLAILPKGFLIERLKVTNPLLRGAVDSHFNYNQRGRYEQDARPVWVLLLLRFQHEGFSTRYNLGGVPIDVASAAGLHPSPEWQAAFETFAGTIRNHCVMVNENRERREGGQNTPLLSITQEHSMARITAAADCFDASDISRRIHIQLSGIAIQPSLNGSHTVYVLDSRNALTMTSMLVHPNITGGFVAIRKKIKIIHPISKVSLLRLSSRKRGYGHSYPTRTRRRRR